MRKLTSTIYFEKFIVKFTKVSGFEFHGAVQLFNQESLVSYEMNFF